jgi:hypothetical protein
MTDKPYTIIETADPLRHLPTIRAVTPGLDPGAIANAHAVMIDELTRLRAPSLSVNAQAEEFEALADYWVAVARIVDRALLASGRELKSNTTADVDLKDFTDQFYGAVDGFACYHADRAAETAREEQEEAARPVVRSFGDQLFEDMQRLNKLLYGSR